METNSTDPVPSDALDEPGTAIVDGSSKQAGPPKISPPGRKGLLLKTIGIIVFALLCMTGISLLVSNKSSKKPTQTVTINTQNLSAGTLNKVTAETSNGGVVKEQLTISPSTMFKSDVNVQGAVTIGNDVTVKGSSNLLGPVATGNNLTIGGGLTVARNASVAGSLSISGAITAGSLNVGTVNLSSINLTGNFSWSGHLISSGTVPTVSAGNAVSGGTATITGNDSIGTVIINANQSGTVSAGEVAIVKFRNKYTGTPIVQLTPANQDAATAQYYVVAAPDFFSIRTVSNPGAKVSYVFNYFVTQ